MNHNSKLLRKFLYEAQVDPDLRRLIHTIAVAGKYISAKLKAANRKLAGTVNSSEEEQLEVDKEADILLQDMIASLDYVGRYASEEQEAFIETGHRNPKYDVCVDPLDGSSLIDVNLAVGTIVGVYSHNKELPSGHNIQAAIYMLYGPLTTLVYTTGNGVHEFVLNPEGEFVLTQTNIKINERGQIYSPGGLRSDWPGNHQEFITNLLSQNYKLRYSGGLVPDFNQILMKGGGIFSYPALKNNPEGKLRLLFELYPLAYICEQAGGQATDGFEPIRSLTLGEVHQRAPFYVGSRYEVHKASEIMKNF